MDWLKNKMAAAKSFATQLKSADAQLASLAVCAMVAGADGEVEPQERTRIASFLGSSDLFATADLSKLKTTVNDFLDKGVDEILRHDLLRVIKKIASKPDEARAAVYAGIAVAKADGDFEEAEKTVLRDICRTLGLAAADFGLAA